MLCYLKSCTQWRTMITDSSKNVAFRNEPFARADGKDMQKAPA